MSGLASGGAAFRKIRSLGRFSVTEAAAGYLVVIYLLKGFEEGGRDLSLLERRWAGVEWLVSVLSTALLRTARRAQARRAWYKAVAFWSWYADFSGDTQKALRNLYFCARQSESSGRKKELAAALLAWRVVSLHEPYDSEARTTSVRLARTLAKQAEQDGNASAAQQWWAQLLEIAPQDREALDRFRSLTVRWQIASSGYLRKTGDLETFLAHVSPDYYSQCAAAAVLLDMHKPVDAEACALRAINQQPTPLALSLLFTSRIVSGQYASAIDALQVLIKASGLPAVQVQALEELLSTPEAEGLDNHSICEIAASRLGEEVAPSLLLHLQSRNLNDALACLSNRISPAIKRRVSADLLLRTGRHLLQVGETASALRIFVLNADLPGVREALSLLLEEQPPNTPRKLLSDLGGPDEIWIGCVALAEYHLSKLNADETLHALCQLSGLPRETFRLMYPTVKGRLADVVRQLCKGGELSPAQMAQLAGLLLSWISEPAQENLRSASFRLLCEELSSPGRHSPAAQLRESVLREGYLDHYEERWHGLTFRPWDSPYAWCSCSLEYFKRISQLR
ncbi:MAG: hypothetical protein JOY77_10435, partial [Alphaproteobacteria bacterium]|nr:hypothetical protein [Alphaproteobacteria bacterium]